MLTINIFRGSRIVRNEKESGMSRLKHPGPREAPSKSTTHLDEHTHTYALQSRPSRADYPDLTLSLLSTLSNRRPEQSGIGRDYWLDDSSALECRACERKFTTFRRKHHCRICGKIFCGACTTFIDGTKFNVRGEMRVCLSCAQLAERYEDYPTSEEEDEFEERESSSRRSRISADDNSTVVGGRDSPLKTTSRLTKTRSTSPQKKSLFVDKTENAKTTESSKLSDSNLADNHTSPAKDIETTPAPPPLLTIATRREGEAVEIDIPRANRHQGHPNHQKRQQGRQELLQGKDNTVIGTSARLAPLNFTKVAASAASSIFNFASSKRVPSETRVNSKSIPVPSAENRPHSALSDEVSNSAYTSDSSDEDVDSDHDPFIQISRQGGADTSAMFKDGDTIHGRSIKHNGSTKGDNHITPRISTESLGSSNLLRSKSAGNRLRIYQNANDASVASLPPLSPTSSENINKGWAVGLGIERPSYGSVSQQILGPLRWGMQPSMNFQRENRGLQPTDIMKQRSRMRRASTFHRLRHRKISRNGRKVSGNGTRVLSNSSMTSSLLGFEDFEFTDDFLRMGEIHGRQLLRELLTDKDIPNIKQWTEVLVKCLKKISMISVDVSNTTGFDLSNYLKLKRIPGGKISDTLTVDGFVISKNLPLKQMPREIDNPRIMLITFPLEYDQEQDMTLDAGEMHRLSQQDADSFKDVDEEDMMDAQFSSLEPIIAQQNEYLRKLTARIAALKPDIVLSSSTVNGYALELLSARGIAVAPRVKLPAIERASRMTGADVIPSMDKLALHPKLGRCGKFEVRTYLCKRVLRSYFYFSGCDRKLGFTITLRGTNKDVLGKVKECAALMAYVFFNVKLESGLMRDQCLQAPDIKEQQITGPLYSIQIGSYSVVWDLVKKRILSSSPAVNFEAPHLLIELRDIEKLSEKNKSQFAEFEKKFHILLGDKSLKDSNRQKAMKKYLDFWQVSQVAASLPEGFDDLFQIVKKCSDERDHMLQYELSVAGRQWDQFWAARGLSYFDPNYHQNIVTLFSMVCSKNSTPCIGPIIQLVDFYWENDFSLGQFIEHTCLHAGDLCPEGCGLSLKDHYRTYVHGSGKVDVVLEEDTHDKTTNNINGKDDIILTWSFCKICHSTTAVLPLTENAWNYSFGKYLELSFWCRNMKVKGSNCDHDFYRDQIHYFSFRGYMVRIEYSEIDTLRLVPPKSKVFWKPQYDIGIKVKTFTTALEKSDQFFDSVRSRLNRVKLDNTTIEKVEAGSERITELKQKVDAQQRKIDHLCKHIYSNTDVTRHLELNAVVREVQELSSDWNSVFKEFAEKYLPSEKDIRKITAFQLDRLFNSVSEDKKSDNDKSEDEADIKDEKTDAKDSEQRKPKSETKLSEEQKDNDSERNDNDKVTEQAAPSLKKPKHSKSDSSVMQRKYFWENQEKENEGQGNDEFTNFEINSGKVKKLAELFDAGEYFKQREMDKKKMEANNYTPKVVSLKPRVEVYKDVNDAVWDEVPKASEAKRKVKNRKESESNTDENSSQDTLEQLSKNSKGDEDKKTTKRTKKPEGTAAQPEKLSLLRSLTHFWEDRSASLWEPLAYPLNFSEHIFVDSDVIVREDEPSSIIAFCLSTSDYSSKLCAALNKTEEELDNAVEEDKPAHNKIEKTQNNTSCVTDKNDLKGTEVHKDNKQKANEKENKNVPLESSAQQNLKSILEHKSDEMSMRTTDEANEDKSTENEEETLESIMLKKGFHLKYQFEEGYSTIWCKIFFAEQFEAFRKQCGVSGHFLQSLSRCVKWDSAGGKSGSAFLKTLDDRFVIKELSKAELQAFVQFAPSYFEYFAQALFHNLPTVLVKIFGFYQIQVKNTFPGGKSYTIDALVMENLFYNRKMSRIFDLKGSMRNRHVEQTGKENEVLLDENMVEYIYESPLFVGENAKRLLRASLWNDTLFLAKMNVMDYSLVIGIDSESKELVVGIIDCIRTFTWDKKLESWVKEKGLVGGGGVGKEPTVITPKQYKNRFREAMERYILMAPGAFYQGTT